MSSFADSNVHVREVLNIVNNQLPTRPTSDSVAQSWTRCLKEFRLEGRDLVGPLRQRRQVLELRDCVIAHLGHVAVDPPPKKTFDAEGAILEQALTKCLHDRSVALEELADAARRVDKAAFGNRGDFGPAHQALLKALDRAGDFI